MDFSVQIAVLTFYNMSLNTLCVIEFSYFFRGEKNFITYNDIYFHIIFREINCHPKIVWIYVIKFFSPQKKYGISSPVGEEISYFFRDVNFILFHTFFAWFIDIIDWDSMHLSIVIIIHKRQAIIINNPRITIVYHILNIF